MTTYMTICRTEWLTVDIVKPPWEEPPSSPERGETSDASYAAATAAATAMAAAATAVADGGGDGGVFPPGAFERRAPTSIFSTDAQVRFDMPAMPAFVAAVLGNDADGLRVPQLPLGCQCVRTPLPSREYLVSF